MFYNLKKELYFKRLELLMKKGFKEGKIVYFDNEFYDKMNNTYINSMPVSMHIKYLRPILPPGKCYDRSLMMFLCFDDALLVRADKKALEYQYGKAEAGHGWIEIGNYVYDPTTLLRFDKDLYYKIFLPSDIMKYTAEEYRKINPDFYDYIKNTKIEDFKPGGVKRTELSTTIPLLTSLADSMNDEFFKKEIEEYLELIEYDAKQEFDKLAKKTFDDIKNKKI